MYVRRNIRWSLIWRFAWRNATFFVLYSVAVVGLHKLARGHGFSLAIPYAPLGTIGVAVAFYLAFKNNQAYDRFWEGRKIWGGIVNESRTFANMVLSLGQGAAKPTAETRHRIVKRHLAWINALRIQLRKTTIHERTVASSYVPNLQLSLDRDNTDDVRRYLSDEEVDRLSTTANMATHIVRAQGDEIRRCRENGDFDGFQEQSLHGVLQNFYALQGKCERIKNTPLPRQFAYFSALFVWTFILLLPFGLLGQFEQLGGGDLVWMTVPFTLLIAWIFVTVEIVGDNTEDPFENYVNDVPMSALCRTIEIDLLQMLGEDELPEPIRPVRDILM